MTEPTNFTQRSDHENDSEVTLIDIKATSADPDTEVAIVQPSASDRSEIELFLKHYEYFVGSPVDDPMVWQSQAFRSNGESPSLWSNRLLKAGLVGAGGLTAIAVTGGLLANELVRSAPPSADKTQPTSPAIKSPAQSSAKPSVTPEATPSAPEFSKPSVSAALPKLKIPRVISPAIRSPLPGQVIGLQSVGLEPIPSPPPLTAVPQKETSSQKPQMAQKIPSSKNPSSELSIGMKKGDRSIEAGSVPSSSEITKLPIVKPAPLTQDCQPTCQPQVPGSTPMPPGEEIRSATQAPDGAPVKLQSTQVSPELTRALVTSVAAAIKQSGGKSLSGTKPLQTNSKAVSAPAGKPQSQAKQAVIVGTVSQNLQHSIESAQTIQDFLTLSQTLPTNLQVAVVSLTPQAALALPNANKNSQAEITVPNTKDSKQFQVFRLPNSTYEKAWIAMTQTAGKPLSSPKYGFIDYQQNAIVLPSPQ